MIMLHVGRSAFAAASERGSPRKTPPTAFVNAPADKRQHNDGCQRHGEKSAGTIGDSAESRHIDQKFSEKTVERRQSAD